MKNRFRLLSVCERKPSIKDINGNFLNDKQCCDQLNYLQNKVDYYEFSRRFDLYLDACVERECNRGKWISVNDRLPAESVPILLWLPKQRIVDTGYYSPLGFFVLRNLKWDLDDVTHWQPLPEPPIPDLHLNM